MRDSVWKAIDVFLIGQTTSVTELNHLQAVFADSPISESLSILPRIPAGEFLLIENDGGSKAVTFVAAPRTTSHARHLRKYADGRLPPHRCFFLRRPDGRLVASVGSLGEFVEALDPVDDEVLAFHASRGDFSRWLRDVVADRELGGQFLDLSPRIADLCINQETSRMSATKPWVRRAVSAYCLVLLLFASAPAQQQASQPPLPSAPDWALIAGWDVYVKKGCVQCHGVRSASEGRAAPDLARIQSGAGFYELGAAMWNHLPLMGAKMREKGIERPALTPLELANVLAFIFTAQYYDELGNAKTGERLFTTKGCVQCHAVGGKGGNVGPALDALKRTNSPVLVAARMWSHGPGMAEAMRAKGIERPTFRRNEMVDIIAFITATASDPGGETAQVLPGTPQGGETLFRDKQCAVCHTIGGKGGQVGPELGRAHHISVTQFAGLMWNHGPAMWARMKDRGVEVPQLTGQEMADIVAYLYTSHYFDPAAGSGARGRQVAQTKGCVACHSVRGKGGKVAADFATSNVVGSPAALIAAMWNHSRSMEDQATKQGLKLPTLKGQELADMSAYLRSLTKASAPRQTK